MLRCTRRSARAHPRAKVYVPVCTFLSVFSAALSTTSGMGANQSFAVYFDAWPCVSAQNTIFRTSIAFDDESGRMMYV